jgi:hypothetical protein
MSMEETNMNQRKTYTDGNHIISTGARVGIRAAIVSIKLGLKKNEIYA